MWGLFDEKFILKQIRTGLTEKRGLADSCIPYSKYMNHFPTLFLDSHLALRHLVNTRLPVSRTTEMVHLGAAVQKAS